MKKLITILILLLITFVYGTFTGYAQSLWTDNSESCLSPKKVTGYKVGDLLTIIISEKSAASSKAGVDTKENTSIVVGPGAGLLTELLPYLQGTIQNSYNGSNSSSKSDSLTAKLTVTIVDIEPETGNLLFEGTKEIKVNNDNQILYFKGKVRPSDIRADNTVYSANIADAKIEYSGKDYSTSQGF